MLVLIYKNNLDHLLSDLILYISTSLILSGSVPAFSTLNVRSGETVPPDTSVFPEPPKLSSSSLPQAMKQAETSAIIRHNIILLTFSMFVIFKKYCFCKHPNQKGYHYYLCMACTKKAWVFLPVTRPTHRGLRIARHS